MAAGAFSVMDPMRTDAFLTSYGNGHRPAVEARRLSVMNAYPRARWIVALRFHPDDHHMPGVKFFQRVGTAPG